VPGLGEGVEIVLAHQPLCRGAHAAKSSGFHR
jgi:hypothetical protein